MILFIKDKVGRLRIKLETDSANVSHLSCSFFLRPYHSIVTFQIELETDASVIFQKKYVSLFLLHKIHYANKRVLLNL